MKRVPGILAVALALTAVAQDNDEKQLRARFSKEWAQKDLQRRKDALRELARANHRTAARMALEAVGDLIKQHAKLSQEKAELMAQLGRIPRHKCVDDQGKVIDEELFKKRVALDERAKQQELAILENEELQEAARDAVAAFESRDAIDVFLQHFTLKDSAAHRRLLANAFGRMKDEATRQLLVEQFDKDHPPDAQVAMIDALRDRRESSVWRKLLDLYETATCWQVRVAILRAQIEFDVLEAVDPLIALLAKADGRLKWEINDVLVFLTGTNKHADHHAWQAWWEESRNGFKDLRPPRDKRMDALRNGRLFFDERYRISFYDIGVRSKRVTFVLDLSASMREKPEVATRQEDRDRTKMQIVQNEMKRVIQSLPRDAEFNIIFYNDDVMYLSTKGLIPAHDKNKERAIRFIDAIKPFGATNVFDALEGVFRPLEVRPEDRFKSQADTIFLLTDGVPTAGTITERWVIMNKIKRLNRECKVVIHTILVGTDRFSEEFLKELSSASDGQFVQR